MVKDWSYLAAFKRKDLPSVQKMAAHIRQTHDTNMIEDINQRFEDKASSLDNGVEIVDVTKTEDLVVNAGLQQCISIILGTSSARWRYIGYGHFDASNPLVTDTDLAAPSPNPRLDTTTQGWQEAQGMKLFFGAIMGETVLGVNVKEMGVFTASSGLGMLNHNVFNNNPLSRTQGRNVFILSCVVEFCPVV